MLLVGLVPDIAESVGPAVSSAAGDPGSLLERLVNTLAGGTAATLVIDDYHLLANPAIDEAIETLIGLAPPTFRLVLVSRLDPSIRLSRLRVRSQLVEVRADALSFDSTEAQLLLRDADPDVTADHADALCERTEGWAAGLVLAGLSLRGPATTTTPSCRRSKATTGSWSTTSPTSTCRRSTQPTARG